MVAQLADEQQQQQPNSDTEEETKHNGEDKPVSPMIRVLQTK